MTTNKCISYEAGREAMNFLSFCLSGKVFTAPHFLNDGFAQYSILGWWFVLFIPSAV
jgi:hypothetical protein